MATIAENLESAVRAVQSPQQHMEHALSPWVRFLAIPLFALSSAELTEKKNQSVSNSARVTYGER